jgi:menaquinone-dependent protoporphyrinogen oxidase
MVRVLIAYGTTEGQTAKIARRLADCVKRLGHEADVTLAGEAGDRDLADYDLVVVGASMHEGRYQREVRLFIESNRAALGSMPGAFFSVSLGAASDKPAEQAEVEQVMRQFCTDCGWEPTQTRSFAGALRYTQYSWLKRKIMQHIVAKEGGPIDPTQDFEFTDWDDVDRFAAEIVDAA